MQFNTGIDTVAKFQACLLVLKSIVLHALGISSPSTTQQLAPNALGLSLSQTPPSDVSGTKVTPATSTRAVQPATTNKKHRETFPTPPVAHFQENREGMRAGRRQAPAPVAETPAATSRLSSGFGSLPDEEILLSESGSSHLGESRSQQQLRKQHHQRRRLPEQRQQWQDSGGDCSKQPSTASFSNTPTHTSLPFSDDTSPPHLSSTAATPTVTYSESPHLACASPVIQGCSSHPPVRSTVSHTSQSSNRVTTTGKKFSMGSTSPSVLTNSPSVLTTSPSVLTTSPSVLTTSPNTFSDQTGRHKTDQANPSTHWREVATGQTDCSWRAHQRAQPTSPAGVGDITAAPLEVRARRQLEQGRGELRACEREQSRLSNDVRLLDLQVQEEKLR